MAQSTLSIGESLISTYVGSDRTYVWAIPHAGEVAFSSVDLGREDVEDSVAYLRAALNPDAETLGDIPEYDLAEVYSLYEKLLKPVEAGWKRAKSLCLLLAEPGIAKSDKSLTVYIASRKLQLRQYRTHPRQSKLRHL